MDSRKAVGIVIGLPMNMDGTEGVRCQSSRALGRNLLRLNPDLPITFWDERLSTAAVTRVLIDEHDVNRKRRGEVVDKMAAGWILQGALERIRGSTRRRGKGFRTLSQRGGEGPAAQRWEGEGLHPRRFL